MKDKYQLIVLGKSYNIILKYVPAVWDFDNNKYNYTRKKDSTIIWSSASDLGINPLTTYNDLYNEQDYHRKSLPYGTYLFYFSPQINDKYVQIDCEKE